MQPRRGAGVPSPAAPPPAQTGPVGHTPACEMGRNTGALRLFSPPTVLGSKTPSSCGRDPRLRQGKTGQERGCRGPHGTTLGHCHSAQQTGSSTLGAWGLWRCIPGRARRPSPPCQADMAPCKRELAGPGESPRILGPSLPHFLLVPGSSPGCASSGQPSETAYSRALHLASSSN